jgi:hypothetical protein
MVRGQGCCDVVTHPTIHSQSIMMMMMMMMMMINPAPMSIMPKLRNPRLQTREMKG